MPNRYPEPISKPDGLFWDALKAHDEAQDVSKSKQAQQAAQVDWESLRSQLTSEDRDLIQKRRRSPVAFPDPEVRTWTPMEMHQCPYCRAWTSCSRLSALPRRCPNCFMLIDRREVKP